MSIPHTVINVFIGWDSREPIAADVCAYSILKHASVPVKIHYLKLDELERDKIITRKREHTASTEFTYTRFLVPYLMDYQGKAIFCDCDFLWTQDIKEVYDNIDEFSNSVSVVPHENYGYSPKTKLKMDGKTQSVYPKKNWSSMMVFNCEHRDCRRLSLDNINKQPLSYLHRFEWTKESNIRFLQPTWNWLSGYYEEKDWGKPGAIHYTDGGPWFDDNTLPKEYQLAGIGSWSQVQYGDLWLEYLDEYKQQKEQDLKRIVGVDQLQYSIEYKKYFTDLKKILDDVHHVYDDTPKLADFVNRLKNHHKTDSVLGISDMEELSESLIKKGYKWDKVVDFFTTGAGGSLTDWKTVYEGHADQDTRPIVFRGITKRHIYDWCREKNRDFYFVDTGYYGNGKSKLWHRVTKNSLQYCGELRDVPGDRFTKANGYTKKFTSGSKILVVPPSDKAMSFYGEDLDVWMETTIKEIEKYTDRPIEIRLKKTRKERVLEETIQKALQDDVHCTVTYNSIAAVESLMEGKPAFVLGQNAASPLCSNDLSLLETPVIPTEDEVYYLLCNLAYHQFTQGELQDGTAWRLLQEWYSK